MFVSVTMLACHVRTKSAFESSVKSESKCESKFLNLSLSYFCCLRQPLSQV